MKYRIEKKFICTEAQLRILESRISAVMPRDAHLREKGFYTVRSLYFDTLGDACMRDNDAGVDDREKYRIRTYNCASEPVHLEIKEKRRGYCHKEQCNLSTETAEALTRGRLPEMDVQAKPVLRRFWLAAATRLLHPAAIIQYERTAYVYPAGNVRITFDRNISVSDSVGDFLKPQLPLLPVLPTGIHLLEVKYDEFLPEHIAQLLELGNLQQTTFSKYYIGRLTLGH